MLRGGNRADGGLGRASPQGGLGSGREKLWKPERGPWGGSGAEGGGQELTAGLRRGAGGGGHREGGPRSGTLRTARHSCCF